jgi:thiosulfate dehydrogenase
LPRTKLEWLHLKEEDKEMKAMIAYIEYIGKDVPKGRSQGSGIYDLEF